MREYLSCLCTYIYIYTLLRNNNYIFLYSYTCIIYECIIGVWPADLNIAVPWYWHCMYTYILSRFSTPVNHPTLQYSPGVPHNGTYRYRNNYNNARIILYKHKSRIYSYSYVQYVHLTLVLFISDAICHWIGYLTLMINKLRTNWTQQ